jgi:hypothetical protein
MSGNIAAKPSPLMGEGWVGVEIDEPRLIHLFFTAA